MGIVVNQSIKNTVITYFGFGIGAINTLFLYTNFLGKTYYGIVSYVLSASTIMMPLMAFGVHNTLIRFYSKCKTEAEREKFLGFMLFMPLVLIIPISLITIFFYHQIALYLSAKNPVIEPFIWLIPVIGLFMGYFEIYYAWVKVHMRSVFGNFINEILVRVLILTLLFAVYLQWLEKETFIYSLAVVYFLQMFTMMVFAMYVKLPIIHFKRPDNIYEIFGYSTFIILSGSIAVSLLEFDKIMIPAYIDIGNNALYSIAGYIATVIVVPSRAMHQILYPITAKLMGESKFEELNILYKKSAINLQVVGGLIMLYIFLNIKELYLLIPLEYRGGLLVVFLLGLSKFYDVMLGNNNAIIFNSKYYKTVLLFGLLLMILMIVLNVIFIPLYGIEGSALATFFSVIIYNTVKLFFVVKKMHLYPFSVNTIKSFGIIVFIFLLFYFWDFSFHPLINIILKSTLITLCYVYLNYRYNISTEINQTLKQFYNIAILKIK